MIRSAVLIPDRGDIQESVKKKRVYKKRKSTSAVRKEEKLALEDAIAALETQLESLKLRRGGEDTNFRRKITHNEVLRDAIQQQHLVMASAQRMILDCVRRQSHGLRPTEMFIHLTTDRRARHETIGMHPTAEYFHEEKYETPEGDLCNVRFERLLLRGVKGGIRAVVGALKQAAFNAEIIISDRLGNLTIREDENLTDEDFFQMRLLTQMPQGFLVENNLVRFTEFYPADGGDSYAVTAADFVDVDDLYPFKPHERIRRDATAAILITSHVDTNTKQSEVEGGNTSSEDEGESDIVITRWVFTRICHTELNIPHQILQEIRDLSDRVSETMMNCVRKTVGLSE
ncbi:hypothetical protein PHMEG_00010508 [Phytophthora megakarya]|uniref:Uncharacterized protein n=1 Tax=Phytophthora megakarya TaxID=4795 RepID=A0A225WF94_9STRA|nr:hypothetical protein PHMEG_00010508 [Phytophthora megakarya]